MINRLGYSHPNHIQVTYNVTLKIMTQVLQQAWITPISGWGCYAIGKW